MNHLRDLAAAWLRQGRPACVVELAECEGSVPREAGTRLLVAQHEVAGTIGGGRLEFEAIAHARQALPACAPFERRYALGPSLGQCCGGRVMLRFTALDAAALARWPLEQPLLRLMLFGAGHVGREIVRALERLPVIVDWVDERDDEFQVFRRERAAEGRLDDPANTRLVAVDSVQAEVAGALPGTCYLVLTHSHDLDLAICEAVLHRGDFAFLGLIGSATKHARFLSRLRSRGLPPDLLRRLTCPIGLHAIRSKRPELIAVGVVAQLLSLAATEPRNEAELAPRTTPEETS